MEDFAPETLAAELGGRELRVYPALVSTEAEALAWARGGAPDGAVVVADYQAAPRFRESLPWRLEQGKGVGFSLVMRPKLLVHREGWLFTVAALGVADCIEGAVVEWPDRLVQAQAPAGVVAVRTEVDGLTVQWAVATVLVREAPARRAALLARLVQAIETRAAGDAAACLSDYRHRLASLGRRLHVQVLPTGGPISGTAVDTRDDGGLVLEVEPGRRVTVLPQHTGRIATYEA